MNRIYQLDFLRGIAIVMVILIHVITRFPTSEQAFASDYFASLLRPCIAIFIFISGYLLKDKIKTWAQLTKRFNRVLIPYLFFSFFAIVYRIAAQILNHREIKFSEYIIDLFLGNTNDIYYFVFIILITYILYFLILKSKISYKYFLVLFGIILIIHNLFVSSTIFSDYYEYRYIFWPFYFFLGIYCHKKNIIQYLIKPKVKSLIFLLWILSLLRVIFVYVTGTEDPNSYNSLSVSLYSIITILLLLSFSFKSRVIIFLSQVSYFLYLSHIFVIYIILDFNDYIFHFNSYIILTSFTLIFTFAIPLIFFYIQKKLFKNKIAFLLGL